MRRVFSNGPQAGDYVANPFTRLLHDTTDVCLAAPYFTSAADILEAHGARTVRLLVGLNAATSPDALAAVHGRSGIAVRYLTHRFHAKLYIFGDTVLVGSANLTDGGLRANREAVIQIDRETDAEAVEDLKTLFAELWQAARVLTPEMLATFRRAHAAIARRAEDLDSLIEKAVGRAEPVTIHVGSRKLSSERLFLEGLRRQVHEEYRPAFLEVQDVLMGSGFRRRELDGVGPANETNRFLNWVRLTRVIGDEAWQQAPILPYGPRRAGLLELGREWAATDDHRVPDDFIDWLRTVERVFGDRAQLEIASKADLDSGLMSLHAFEARHRFVKGGRANLLPEFWKANRNDLGHVRENFVHLLYGRGDAIERLHDTLYAPRHKLSGFGLFCSLELYGTIHPSDLPPLNGRIAKALRFLGYAVQGA